MAIARTLKFLVQRSFEPSLPSLQMRTERFEFRGCSGPMLEATPLQLAIPERPQGLGQIL